ncbi:MAG: DUF456 domain-containing protein [Candidatus Nanohaloarchaea archaeon]
MADLFLVAAVLLLLLGVIGSLTPMMPGALLSVAGVALYYWSTGFGEPGFFFTLFAVLIGVGAFLADYFAGAISAKMGGASTKTAIASAFAGLLLFFVAGPAGMLLGVALTVFLIEFYRTEKMEESVKAAAYSTAGLLASTAVQLIVTVALLLGFLIDVAL